MSLSDSTKRTITVWAQTFAIANQILTDNYSLAGAIITQCGTEHSIVDNVLDAGYTYEIKENVDRGGFDIRITIRDSTDIQPGSTSTMNPSKLIPISMQQRSQEREPVYSRYIDIQCDPSQVWEILADKASWGKWFGIELVDMELRENGNLKWRNGSLFHIIAFKEREAFTMVGGNNVSMTLSLSEPEPGCTRFYFQKDFSNSTTIVLDPSKILEKIEGDLESLKKYVCSLCSDTQQDTKPGSERGSEPGTPLEIIELPPEEDSELVVLDASSMNVLGYNPPSIDDGRDYYMRCMASEYTDGVEMRTFKDDPSFTRVVTLLNDKQYSMAIIEGMKVLELYPDLDIVYSWIASAYRWIGQLAEAHKSLVGGVAKSRRKSFLLYKIGEIEALRGDIAAAVYAWLQALQSGSCSNEIEHGARLFLGQIARGLGIEANRFLDRADSIKGDKVRLADDISLTLETSAKAFKGTVLEEVIHAIVQGE